MSLDWLLAFAVVGLTWAVLRGGWRQDLARIDLRPQGDAILMAVLAIAVAVFFLGVIGGLALIVSIAVHEFGHVAAYRVAGHPDATFRLIPFFGGVASSSKAPASDAHDLYIVIMGPGICLALMTVAWLLYTGPFTDVPYLGPFFAYLASITGLLNFFNLLPIYPLDGGRIAYTIFGKYAPAATRNVLMVVTTAIGILAILRLNLLLLYIALMSFQAVRTIGHSRTRMRPMSDLQSAAALGAWLAMLAAFFMGGSGLMMRFLPL